MELRDKLEIILITYNRRQHLENTLNQLFSEESPVKNLDITILDNCSTDGSSELISGFADKFSNLKHVRHNRNIGGCTNAARIYEIVKKEYVWGLCDDDSFDWTHFGEIEKAIEEGYDLISTCSFDESYKNKLAMIYCQFSFLPAFICKTDGLDFNTMENITSNISNLYPHLAIVAKAINEDKKIHIIEHDVVKRGLENDVYFYKTSTRGMDNKKIWEYRRYMFWFIGYINACQMIEDKKIRDTVLDSETFYNGSWFELLYEKIQENRFHHGNCKKNLFDIFCGLNNKRRLIMLLAAFLVKLRYLFVKKVFVEPSSKEDWVEYFKKNNQQRKINQLARKYKNKKVVVYGGGLIFETLVENYDLSKLNITAVADKKFTEETELSGYKAIPPEKINECNPGAVLVTLYRPVLCKKTLEKVAAPNETILSKSFFYPAFPCMF